MKNKRFIFAFLCVCLLCTVCLAAGKALLSPALEHIEKNLSMKKCALYQGEVSFTKEDFDTSFHGTPEFIKIETLPDLDKGILYLGTLRISEDQVIERKDFDKISFVSRVTSESECDFVFSDTETGLAVNCRLYLLEEENLPPILKNQTISTTENISAFNFLSATDPDGDALTYKIISYPTGGTLRISENSGGYFSYTPKDGYTGKDSFVYTAVDKYGNTGATATVKIDVSENTSNIYYDDMKNHWAHNAAVRTSALGLMSGERDAYGAYNFNPTEAVTRGDFLAMALICAGKEPEIEFVTQTSFADDSEIPLNIKSYAAYALNNGIISGYPDENGNAVFSWDSPITRAEAAVIAERILDIPDTATDISVFSDYSSTPVWARDAVSKLNACGIFKGTGFGELLPDSTLTKAQTAEILCNISDY